MVSFSLIAIAIVIVAEGALAFLGLSVEPPTPTWGFMINEGREELSDAAWISLIPASVMFATILSLNLLGDIFTARFQVKESGL
jgi:peptide/nickel transport system permease protein